MRRRLKDDLVGTRPIGGFDVDVVGDPELPFGSGADVGSIAIGVDRFEWSLNPRVIRFPENR